MMASVHLLRDSLHGLDFPVLFHALFDPDLVHPGFVHVGLGDQSVVDRLPTEVEAAEAAAERKTPESSLQEPVEL